MTHLLQFVLIFTCVNSRQARNTHHSDHWSAPLFMFYCLPRILAHACAIKSKQTATSCDASTHAIDF